VVVGTLSDPASVLRTIQQLVCTLNYAFRNSALVGMI
jgi:hypothetical protein